MLCRRCTVVIFDLIVFYRRFVFSFADHCFTLASSHIVHSWNVFCFFSKTFLVDVPCRKIPFFTRKLQMLANSNVIHISISFYISVFFPPVFSTRLDPLWTWLCQKSIELRLAQTQSAQGWSTPTFLKDISCFIDFPLGFGGFFCAYW